MLCINPSSPGFRSTIELSYFPEAKTITSPSYPASITTYDGGVFGDAMNSPVPSSQNREATNHLASQLFQGESSPTPCNLQNEFSHATSMSYRTETRRSYICTFRNCNKCFSRIYDLHRHHRGAHDKRIQFNCRHSGCPRNTRGFPRKDKRDEHERKVHG